VREEGSPKWWRTDALGSRRQKFQPGSFDQGRLHSDKVGTQIGILMKAGAHDVDQARGCAFDQALESSLQITIRREDESARVEPRQQECHQAPDRVDVVCNGRRFTSDLLWRHESGRAESKGGSGVIDTMRQLQIQQPNPAALCDPHIRGTKVAMDVAGCMKAPNNPGQLGRPLQESPPNAGRQLVPRPMRKTAAKQVLEISSLDVFEGQVAVPIDFEVWVCIRHRQISRELGMKNALTLQSITNISSLLVRVCPKTSGGITKFSEHEAD
jgi:hypothetical protein